MLIALLACGSSPPTPDVVRTDTAVPTVVDTDTDVVPGPPDGDADGVPDELDGCRQTPPGTVVAVTGLATGCAILPDTLLSELNAAAWTVICQRALADEQDIVCDGFTIEQPSLADCVDVQIWPPDCAATFGDWETCEAFDFADECQPDPSEVPPACFALNACQQT